MSDQTNSTNKPLVSFFLKWMTVKIHQKNVQNDCFSLCPHFLLCFVGIHGFVLLYAALAFSSCTFVSQAEMLAFSGRIKFTPWKFYRSRRREKKNPPTFSLSFPWDCCSVCTVLLSSLTCQHSLMGTKYNDLNMLIILNVYDAWNIFKVTNVLACITDILLAYIQLWQW